MIIQYIQSIHPKSLRPDKKNASLDYRDPLLWKLGRESKVHAAAKGFRQLKFCCAECIQGHRSSQCTHIHKPLFFVKDRGQKVQHPNCNELYLYIDQTQVFSFDTRTMKCRKGLNTTALECNHSGSSPNASTCASYRTIVIHSETPFLKIWHRGLQKVIDDEPGEYEAIQFMGARADRLAYRYFAMKAEGKFQDEREFQRQFEKAVFEDDSKASGWQFASLLFDRYKYSVDGTKVDIQKKTSSDYKKKLKYNATHHSPQAAKLNLEQRHIFDSSIRGHERDIVERRIVDPQKRVIEQDSQPKQPLKAKSKAQSFFQRDQPKNDGATGYEDICEAGPAAGYLENERFRSKAPHAAKTKPFKPDYGSFTDEEDSDEDFEFEDENLPEQQVAENYGAIEHAIQPEPQYLPDQNLKFEDIVNEFNFELPAAPFQDGQENIFAQGSPNVMVRQNEPAVNFPVFRPQAVAQEQQEEEEQDPYIIADHLQEFLDFFEYSELAQPQRGDSGDADLYMRGEYGFNGNM